MKQNSKFSRWLINVWSFVLLAVLVFTGMINWWVLPRGYAARGSIWVQLRHLLIDVHQWAGLLFVLVIVVHLWLHRAYISANLTRKSGSRN